MEKKIKACVTGGAGYLGSSLVKVLLEKGYTVHATLRNTGETSKVALLTKLPYAAERLVLFQADIYNPSEFAAAIEGCQVVFHLATPLLHYPGDSRYANTTKAAVAGVKGIVESCIKSGTVKRIVYTATVMAASPLEDDGSGYKDSIDESCWTPLNLSIPYNNDHLQGYIDSKTLAEKEVLSYNSDEIEVVSLVCGLVGGDTILPYLPASLVVLMSQYLKKDAEYGTLRFIEELLGKVPIVHVDDIVEAHIFCMQKSVKGGRYLCASDFVKSAEIAACLEKCLPDIRISDRFKEETSKVVKWGSSKLEDLGFRYQHDADVIIHDSIQCARRLCSSI